MVRLVEGHVVDISVKICFISVMIRKVSKRSVNSSSDRGMVILMSAAFGFRSTILR